MDKAASISPRALTRFFTRSAEPLRDLTVLRFFEKGNVRVGLFSTKLGCPHHVRFTRVSDRTADTPDRQLCAATGDMRRPYFTCSG
jgi:hypothetical protein